MLQISNTSYRFRKRKLNSKTNEISVLDSETRAESTPSYLKSFKSIQNSCQSISIPKNIKILPKLEKTFLYTPVSNRYFQSPSNDSLFGGFQPATKETQQQDRKRNIFFRADKNDQREKKINLRPATDFKNNIVVQLLSDTKKTNEPKYYVVNKQGKRPYNEDRFICKHQIQKFYFKNHLKKSNQKQEQIDLYCIFDGHGGSACAQFLKQNFANFLVRTKNLDSNPQQSLRQAFAISQQKFLSLCQTKKFQPQTSGACAISCIVTETKVIVASVGDCRAIMFNMEFLCQMTKDHKPTDINEKMRILKCGGKVFKEQVKLNQFTRHVKFFTSTRIAPGNLNVSRTLGDIETKLKKYGGLPGMISAEPDVKTFQKQNYQILLLASDGLFQAFTNLEVQKLYQNMARSEAKSNLSFSQLAKKFLDKLTQEAESKSTDNITIIVVPLITNKIK